MPFAPIYIAEDSERSYQLAWTAFNLKGRHPPKVSCDHGELHCWLWKKPTSLSLLNGAETCFPHCYVILCDIFKCSQFRQNQQTAIYGSVVFFLIHRFIACSWWQTAQVQRKSCSFTRSQPNNFEGRHKPLGKVSYVCVELELQVVNCANKTIRFS